MSVALKNLTKTYGDFTAVDTVSFTVSDGALLALVGESGSGKTTTLKMINRLIEPDAGVIAVDGENVLAQDAVSLRRTIGYVFQGVGLFPHMSVAENIAITPRLLGWSEEEIATRIDEMLALVQLDPAQYRDRAPSELSGGQQQRVGFARALAAKPSLMLMDEPFGALDPVTRHGLRAEFQEIRARLGFTAVLVTHDMAEALLMADQVAVMQNGRILQIASPAEILAHPADEYVAALVSTPKSEADALEALVSA
ncbi:MAG: ABC transporter ATP-binding protein [Alphaproteobacteria bacterium]